MLITWFIRQGYPAKDTSRSQYWYGMIFQNRGSSVAYNEGETVRIFGAYPAPLFEH